MSTDDEAESWAGVEDRWTKTVRDTDGNTKTVPSANNGNGMRWRARYVDDEGREHAKRFIRKVDAQQWLDDITSRFVTGTYTPPEAGRATVAAVYAAWSAAQGHIAAKTALTRRSTWSNHVEARWGEVAVVDVKTSAVRAWVAQLVASEVGVATIENAFGLLRLILGAAVEDNRIPSNPCAGVRLPKRAHPDRGYLTHAQVAALAGAVKRHREVVRFLAYTGLRFGEMAALRVGDVDMLRRRANVSRSVTEAGRLIWRAPKTGERRSVPFPAVLADELAALMVGKGRDDLLFTNTRGGVLHGAHFRADVFAPAVAECQKTGRRDPDNHPAGLRHPAAFLTVMRARTLRHCSGCLGTPKRR